MTQSRAFRTLEAARLHRDEVAKQFNLPEMYSQADLDDGTLREVGGGRHVPVENIVKRDMGKIYVSKTGKTYIVTAVKEEIEDVRLGLKIMRRDVTELEEKV